MTRQFSSWSRATSLAIVLAVMVWAPGLAASRSPSVGAAGGDPRSSGEGPGFVGNPLSAIVVVIGIGLVSLVVTYLYVRLAAARTHP